MTATAPENINTASRFLSCAEEESVGLVSPEIRSQVELVLAKAELYIGGERLQTVLPFDEGSVEDAAAAD